MKPKNRGANGKNGSKWIRPEKRLAIYHRDGFTCVYCGASARDVTLSLDHLKPRSQGGTNDATNLVTACLPCNSKRQHGVRLLPAGYVNTWKTIDISIGRQLLAARRSV